MTDAATRFAPGSLVNARGREWVVLPGNDAELLLVRPLGGADDEVTGLLTDVEEIKHARFDPPTLDDLGDHRSARLLHDALRLGFRNGTGPFRSFGHLGCDPRPYQLVPLMMALRIDPVRLLIADDVGIGKTIEASLVARELLDQGDATGLVVLCPPHLADQWQRELAEKFNIEAETVLAGTAARLERNLGNESIFEHYPNLVVSLDFIKTERRRHEFLTQCPNLVIVDEAHTCADQSGGRANTLRYELVSKVAADPKRHLILITATPHQGKEESYGTLLGFLDDAFADSDARKGDTARARLARHFVQRRRADIKRYIDEDTKFPERDPHDLAYRMTPEYKKFFESVLSFCRELVRDTDGGANRQRVRWWAALGLLRAVGSSPQAAAASLRNRAINAATPEEIDELGRRAVFDQTGDDEVDAPDPTPGTSEDDGSTPVDQSVRRRLNGLAKQAEALVGKADAKLETATKEIKRLIASGYNPIVFCRFIDTAEAVAESLRSSLPKAVTVQAVTGRLPAAEREERVEVLGQHEKRVLVATDCLSEGINLQQHFDAVLHYDLSWNPTRHEQREGRVDRFGQNRDIVKVVTLYGSNNPIDGYILKVILKKHLAIREETGVIVPVPTDLDRLSEAVLEGLLMAGSDDDEIEGQLALFEKDVVAPRQRELNALWDAAKERERVSRSRFAQAVLDPADVHHALLSTRSALGGSPEIHRFATTALRAYGAPVTVSSDTTFSTELTSDLPLALLDQLRSSVPSDKPLVKAKLSIPVSDNEIYLTRTHPLVETLATYTLDTALDSLADKTVARRAAVVSTKAVAKRTTVLVLRLRFRLITDRRTQIAEESIVLGYRGGAQEPEWLSEDEAAALLDAVPADNVDYGRRRDFLSDVLKAIPVLETKLTEAHEQRAEALRDDHRRIRESARARLQGLKVEAIPPPDVLGIYVYLPA